MSRCIYCHNQPEPNDDVCAECLAYDPATEATLAGDEYEYTKQEYHSGGTVDD